MVLRWQTLLWALAGITLVFAPRWLVEGLLDQPALEEEAWLRLAGVLCLAMAGQMVLVARRVEDLWWWSWTFVLLEAATALVLALNALLGLPDGAAAWPWWTLAIVNAAVGVAEIVTLARAGTERSPI